MSTLHLTIPNVSKPASITILAILIFLFAGSRKSSAQDSLVAPAVISDWKQYKAQVLHDPEKKMVELQSVIPDLVYDLRYAGTGNFMGRRMYPAGTNKTFLRQRAANALGKVQEEVAKLGLGLKVYDAYRPYHVSVAFWELIKDERYVANPAKGSGHNRGIAIDLTLISLETGDEMHMGTDFDNFSDTAHHGFDRLPSYVKDNRLILKNAMEKFGFRALDTEWWHYSLPDPANYELLDFPFSTISNNTID